MLSVVAAVAIGRSCSAGNKVDVASGSGGGSSSSSSSSSRRERVASSTHDLIVLNSALSIVKWGN